MYANFGPGMEAVLAPPSSGPELMYSHRHVANRVLQGNLYDYCGNDPRNAVDPSGLYYTYPATCEVTERQRHVRTRKWYCKYECDCPAGGTLGWTPATYWRDCKASPPAPNCVVLGAVDTLCVCAAFAVAMCDSPAPGPGDAVACGILGARGLCILLP